MTTALSKEDFLQRSNSNSGLRNSSLFDSFLKMKRLLLAFSDHLPLRGDFFLKFNSAFFWISACRADYRTKKQNLKNLDTIASVLFIH